jgi:hypothetical protein
MRWFAIVGLLFAAAGAAHARPGGGGHYSGGGCGGGHSSSSSHSGYYDWVLAEITQLEEAGHVGTTAQVPGPAALCADDLDLSREELEDRASVMFWKWIEARASGSRAKLERFCATPGQPSALRTRLEEVAAGSCDATAARRDDAHDRVVVEIRWSAFERDFHQHRLTLVRARGARSRRGLSCLDCPECGGELASSDDATCRYCGKELTGDANDWTLEAIARVE